MLNKMLNKLKTKIQNWLEFNEMIEVVDSVESHTGGQLSIHEARITGLELAQATTEQYARNLHKSISILLEDYYKRQGPCEAEQKLEKAYLKAKKNILKNKNVKKDKQQKNNKGESTKKPKINAFKVSKADFKATFGKGFKKPNKKRGRPAR